MPLFRPTICEVNLSALRHNYRQLKEKAQGREMLTIVKANAYGHGAITVSRTLVAEGATCLGVALVEEAIELRRAGIGVTLLCLGGVLGATVADLVEYNLTPVVFNEEGLKYLAQQMGGGEQRLGIHLKVDTGMGRLGVFPHQLGSLLEILKEAPALELKGVMTHLARADEPDPKPTEDQFQKFSEIERAVRQAGFSSPIFHVANSAALIEEKLKDTEWVRPGIALYGAYPHPRFSPSPHPLPSREGGRGRGQIELKPVMTWKTQIISLKDFPKGAFISYGGTFKTRRPSRIAVIPVGYADGFSRFFSNKGEVLVRGRRVPVVGRVCMDLTMIDVTELPHVMLGDEVILIGEQNGTLLRAEELAEKIGTISYEIFCAISSRVPRLYVSGGEGDGSHHSMD